MTRRQRALHQILWPLLALALAGVTIAAVQERSARVAAAGAEGRAG